MKWRKYTGTQNKPIRSKQCNTKIVFFIHFHFFFTEFKKAFTRNQKSHAFDTASCVAISEREKALEKYFCEMRTRHVFDSYPRHKNASQAVLTHAQNPQNILNHVSLKLLLSFKRNPVLNPPLNLTSPNNPCLSLQLTQSLNMSGRS